MASFVTLLRFYRGFGERNPQQDALADTTKVSYRPTMRILLSKSLLLTLCGQKTKDFTHLLQKRGGGVVVDRQAINLVNLIDCSTLINKKYIIINVDLMDCVPIMAINLLII